MLFCNAEGPRLSLLITAGPQMGPAVIVENKNLQDVTEIYFGFMESQEEPFCYLPSVENLQASTELLTFNQRTGEAVGWRRRGQVGSPSRHTGRQVDGIRQCHG